MKKYKFVSVMFVTLVTIFLSGCVSVRLGSDKSLTKDMLENAEYYQKEWVQKDKIKLDDGVFRKRHSPRSVSELVITLVKKYIEFGDIDGDGIDDAVLIMRIDGGGTGTFYNLVVVVNRDGIPMQVAEEFLGDRIKVKSVSVGLGQVLVKYFDRSPDQPMSAKPTVKTSRFFFFPENKIQKYIDAAEE